LSFIQSISFAINKKSQYGYRHIKNVEKLMGLIIDEINRDHTLYKDIYYSEDEKKVLQIAALIHDIGKIVTPDYVLDKDTRLKTLTDRINEIKERFAHAINAIRVEELKLENSVLKGEVDIDIKTMKKAYQKEIDSLKDDLKFIENINNPTVTLSDKDVERVKLLGRKYFESEGRKIYLLNKTEVENLSVKYGNLTNYERDLINQHAKVGYEMMSKLNFPKEYAKIPQIAGLHHEKLNGKGYPFGLKAEQISLEVRLLTICDIFEALSSSDRPYKKSKSLDEIYKILDLMAEDGDIDSQLVSFIKHTGVFEKYLEKQNSTTEVLEYA